MSELHSEGDLNTSARRFSYGANHSAETMALLDRDSDVFLHQALSTPCLNVVSSCSGAECTTHDGKMFLDFHGNYVHNVGFAHPRIIDAITAAMKTLPFSTRRYTNTQVIELAEKLTGYTKTLKRVLFAPGGAEAIGMALKVARLATGRHKTISLWDSFHGASIEASSIGGEAMFRKDTGPLLTGCHHAPPPNPPDCPFKCGSTCDLSCANYIEYILEKEGDIAAVVAETIRSSPFIPPQEYWKTIRKACDKHGALLILDEIPHALGRTGKMFTFQHYGIEPDMVVIGKALGGGIFPFAALLATDELNDAVKNRAVGHYTHEKNPVASSAALALLSIIEEDNLLSHVDEIHQFTIEHLKPLKEKHSLIYDVRALGLMIGIELRDPQTKEKATDAAERVMYECLKDGLNFKISMGNIINLTPPMNVSKDQVERAIAIINNAMIKHV